MVKDIEPNSPAELGGLKPGDKILILNNENIENASYLEVLNKLKDALLNSVNKEINLVVMNAIEYNIFKSNSNKDTSDTQNLNNNNTKEFRLDTFYRKSIDDFGIDEQIEKTKPPNSDLTVVKDQINEMNEFNPFDDISNEMFTPFLHYTSIPPPDTFKAVDNKQPLFDQFDNSNNSKDDSLEESTTETLSSSVDTNPKKEANSSFNMNDFDFHFTLNNDNKINKDSIQKPSIEDFLNSTKEFNSKNNIWDQPADLNSNPDSFRNLF